MLRFAVPDVAGLDPSCPTGTRSVTWEGLNPPYRTIVADPPWRYQKDTTNGAKPGAAEAHYSTLGMRDIAALPVADLAAPDAHLYLWVTVPRLYGDRDDRSFTPVDLMEVWGFEFKTML